MHNQKQFLEELDDTNYLNITINGCRYTINDPQEIAILKNSIQKAVQKFPMQEILPKSDKKIQYICETCGHKWIDYMPETWPCEKRCDKCSKKITFYQLENSPPKNL
jgi:hypothetical protein